jgi:hypothetical protein
MVKTPKMRHSKSPTEPVTIELQPGEVSRVVEAADAPQTETTDFEPQESKTDAESTIADEPAKTSDYSFDDTPPQTEAHTDTKDEFAAAQQPKRGGMNGLAAGVIGGVIALVGAGALQYAGFLGAPGSSVSLDRVNGEISALKTQIAAISNSENGGEAAARVKGLSDALDQVKADVAALKTSVVSQSGDTSGVTELRDKVTAMETAIAALGAVGNVAPVDLGPINEKLDSLDTLVKSTSDAATEQQSRLGALEQSMSELSAKVEAQASQPKIALAIAASALKAALDRGAPFAAELETFAAIAPDAPQLAALRAYSEKGVATRAEIASGADAAATAMVSAATPLDQNAGFLQNLMSSAESLVKVRPIGAVEGTGVPETVARMEAAIKQGDYAKALAEYGTLPDAVKSAGSDLAEKLKARLDVEAQIDALIAQAMKA